MMLRDFRTIETHDGCWHSATIRTNGVDLYAHDRAGFWAIPSGRDLLPVKPALESMLRTAVAHAHPWHNVTGRRG